MVKVHRKTKNHGEVRINDFGIHSELVGYLDLDEKRKYLSVFENNLFKDLGYTIKEFDGTIRPGDFVIGEGKKTYIVGKNYESLRKISDPICEVYFAP